MFNFQRKSTSGNSVPSWLAHPGPVYVRKHGRDSIYELIEANPEYAFIRLKNGLRAPSVNTPVAVVDDRDQLILLTHLH